MMRQYWFFEQNKWIHVASSKMQYQDFHFSHNSASEAEDSDRLLCNFLLYQFFSEIRKVMQDLISFLRILEQW